ncbi:hypothetical protein [Oceanibacterium hippocampi]|uniref:hypothetical protein n=1 Tax=Oceanibacterium hippocampi TaxID=745714 RepID=UPI00111C38DB|nr:hypothetical protein [Oceanibacterium hippocampi]
MIDPNNDEPKRKLNLSFKEGLATFHGVWAAVDLITDFAIYRFLSVTPEQAHLITSGMMYGRKAQLLADLVGRSDHPKRDKILGALNWIRGGAKRDIVTHGYHKQDENNITFVQRSYSGEFKAVEHSFTNREFRAHVLKLIERGVSPQHT